MIHQPSGALLHDGSPLNDPTYAPRHPPVNGEPPAVVARFGPRTQIRWFQRFRRNLSGHYDSARKGAVDRYHCESLLHRGFCCWQCEGDEYNEPWEGPDCCCRALPAS